MVNHGREDSATLLVSLTIAYFFQLLLCTRGGHGIDFPTNTGPGGQHRALEPWNGSIRSCDSLHDVIASANECEQRCVYYHLPHDTGMPTVGVALGLLTHTIPDLRRWKLYTSDANLLYSHPLTESHGHTSPGVLYQLLPREFPSLVCYKSPFFKTTLTLSNRDSCHGTHGYKTLARWLRTTADKSQSFGHLSVDSVDGVKNCLEQDQTCAIMYISDLSMSHGVDRLLRGFSEICLKFDRPSACQVVSPLFSELQSLIVGTVHVQTSGGIWLYHAAQEPSMLFEASNNGLLRFHLHVSMNLGTPRLLDGVTFEREVLHRPLPWIVIFINCKGDQAQVEKAIDLVLALRRIGTGVEKAATLDVRLGVVDTTCSRNIMTSSVQPGLLGDLPLAILFYRHIEGGPHVHQQRLDTNRILEIDSVADLLSDIAPPGSSAVYVQDFQEADSALTTTIRHKRLNESSDPGNEDQCFLGEQDDGTTSWWDSGSWRTDQQLTSKLNAPVNRDAVQELTASTWREFFQPPAVVASTARSDMLLPEASQVKLVLFLRSECGNCHSKLPIYQKMAKDHSSIAGGNLSFGSVNCSDSRSAQLCSRLMISENFGFPAIIAWRQLHTNAAADSGCEDVVKHEAEEDNWLQLNYHDPLSSADMSEWIRKLLQPTVLLQSSETSRSRGRIMSEVAVPAMLHATFVVNRADHVGKHFSWHCYQQVCRHLFSVAICSAAVEKAKQRSKQLEMDEAVLVLSVLVFYRQDGSQATIFRHGVPIDFANKGESSGGLLAECEAFHPPHRYGLRTSSYCEADRSACSQYIVQFVRDHARPVLYPLSYTNFHMARSLDSLLNSGNNGKLPYFILIFSSQILDVDPMGSSHPLFKTLERLAKRTYTQVKMVTLDSEQFPSWAGRFVPAGYFTRYDVNPQPRLCWVETSDHSQAAFYPPPADQDQAAALPELDVDNMNVEQLDKDLMDFIQSTKKTFLPTETF